MDPLATPAARENVEMNGVQDRVDVLEESATVSRLLGLGPTDGVVANIESGVLSALMPGLAGACREGGWVILSGILASEREAVIRRAAAEGLVLEAEDSEGEWWTGRFIRQAEDPADA